MVQGAGGEQTVTQAASKPTAIFASTPGGSADAWTVADPLPRPTLAKLAQAGDIKGALLPCRSMFDRTGELASTVQPVVVVLGRHLRSVAQAD